MTQDQALINKCAKESENTTAVGYPDLIQNLSSLAQEWERLLFSTSGALNLSKCFWFLLTWKWDNGQAKLHTSSTCPGSVYLTSEDNPQESEIQRIAPTDSFRTLGVHVSPSGCNKGALKT